MRQSEVKRVTLWRHPVITIQAFIGILWDACVGLLEYVRTHALGCALGSLLLAACTQLMKSPPLLLAPLRDEIYLNGSFAAYWLVLGILSSIGLGSGLHTFVLFLGPHIVRIASAGVRLRGTDFSGEITSYFKWPSTMDVAGFSEAFSPNYAPDAWESRTPLAPGGGPVTFSAIAAKIAWPAFLWGLGTALGELPPYFVARAAARTGQTLDEITEVEELEVAKVALVENGSGTSHSSALKGHKKAASRAAAAADGTAGLGAGSASGGIIGRAKLVVFESVQRYGFFAILLAASIPNPLFDLAGITCGHFGISFYTFFGATLLGKAVFKVAIQSSSIVAFVVYGPWMFETLRMAVRGGGKLHTLISNLEAGFLSGQHAMCAREAGKSVSGAVAARAITILNTIAAAGSPSAADADGEGMSSDARAAYALLKTASESAVSGGSSDTITLGGCEACCALNFGHLGFPQCLSQCTDDGSGSESGSSGSMIGAVLKQAPGTILVGMVAYFVLSIVHSIVQERLLRDAIPDEDDATAAAAPSSAASKGKAAGVAAAAEGTRNSAGAALRSSPMKTATLPPSLHSPQLKAGVPASHAAYTPSSHFHGSNVISALAHARELALNRAVSAPNAAPHGDGDGSGSSRSDSATTKSAGARTLSLRSNSATRTRGEPPQPAQRSSSR